MLRNLLGNLLGDGNRVQRDEPVSVELACAVLMVEVAQADNDFSDQDRLVVSHELEKAFDLKSADSKDVLNKAITLHDQHVSFHEMVRVLNQKLEPESRVVLMRTLWRVALSDQIVHRYEEGQIRKIADWLYIPHRDFIRSKLDVQNEMA